MIIIITVLYNYDLVVGLLRLKRCSCNSSVGMSGSSTCHSPCEPSEPDWGGEAESVDAGVEEDDVDEEYRYLSDDASDNGGDHEETPLPLAKQRPRAGVTALAKPHPRGTVGLVDALNEIQ